MYYNLTFLHFLLQFLFHVLLLILIYIYIYIYIYIKYISPNFFRWTSEPASHRLKLKWVNCLSGTITIDIVLENTVFETFQVNLFFINLFIDSNVKHVHLPYGIPRVLQEQSDYCILHHSVYTSGYSRNILMPLWVSYSLNATVRLVLRPHEITWYAPQCFSL